MFRGQDCLQLGDNLQMGGGNVVLFPGVGFQVVKFERGLGTEAVAFPIAPPHRLLEKGLVDFEVEEVVLHLLLPSEQRRHNGDAIQPPRRGTAT